MQYSVIDMEAGVVTNIVEWDGKTPWSPPAGHAVLADALHIGSYFDGTYFSPPPVVQSYQPPDPATVVLPIRR